MFGVLSVFLPADIAAAEDLIAQLRAKKMTLCTAESCTGGLIVGLLTEVPGASDVVDRGLVTYSDAAKIDALGVSAKLMADHGAVSPHVALAMADGALARTKANLSIAVTGIAGPGGGTPHKPVGLVYLAAQVRGHAAVASRLQLGDIGRTAVRLETVRAALALCGQALDKEP